MNTAAIEAATPKYNSPEYEKFANKLVLISVSVLLLLGSTLLVSANSHIPVSLTSEKLMNLSGSAVDKPAYFYNANSFYSGQSELSSVQAQTETMKIALSNEALKIRALNLLRSMPEQAVSSKTAKQGLLKNTSVNVNTFLLANRVNNHSQLAQLQMQPMFAEFNSRIFTSEPMLSVKEGSPNAKLVTRALDGVGFPHIETNNRDQEERYKPYRQLVSISENDQAQVVPYVRCMGLSPEQVAERAKAFDSKIYSLAVKHNVSVSLVKAVVTKESCFNTKARSHVGAIGLMQLMPETAKWLKVSKPENVDQNLAAGVRYLAQLRKRFGSNELALAAYNAGPGNVERYNGIPPFEETENYVEDVMHFYRGYVATTRFVNALNDY